ncbi:hypothetical protein D3C79_942570 [compost metagenome]
MLLLAQVEVVRLQGLQPVLQRLLRPRAADDRQAVDEQADLPLDALELGRTPGHGGAEGDIVLAAVMLQQQ